MLPPKTSQHSKFHRDRSNQLGDRGVSFGPRTKKNLFCHGQKRDYLSHGSQCARGAKKIQSRDILRPRTVTSELQEEDKAVPVKSSRPSANTLKTLCVFLCLCILHMSGNIILNNNYFYEKQTEFGHKF